MILLFAALMTIACGDANQSYVRKAVKIMDKEGLFAEGPEWEAAKAEALASKPASLEEAQDAVKAALKVAGVQRQPRIECPVAILTNEWTGSSGEAVLLCFRGLDNVRVFGSPTAGYASSNQPFTMSDGATMWLTTGCDVARTGETFCDDPIDPDVTTETPMQDALAWLRSQ